MEWINVANVGRTFVSGSTGLHNAAASSFDNPVGSAIFDFLRYPKYLYVDNTKIKTQNMVEIRRIIEWGVINSQTDWKISTEVNIRSVRWMTKNNSLEWVVILLHRSIVRV